MKPVILRAAAFAAATLLLASASGLAQDKPAATRKEPPKASQKQTAPAAKPVDLNSASKADLTKVEGFNDAIADKIIAARPFRTKAELVTRKIITEAHYGRIRKNVIAVQKESDPTKAQKKKS